MFAIRYAQEVDRPFWYSLDEHLPESEFALKIRDRRCYVVCDGDMPVGVMRYNLFWDKTPFLTLIYLDEPYRRKGYGGKAMAYWEEEMHALGYRLIMTSTQADEEAQHFYRKLGYKDAGCLVLNTPPDEQPLEIFLLKIL